MQALDYAVLAVYFLVMTLIGVLSMLKVKKQEDFFLGSRTFGKVFQAFAAFGAGTGSHDPVTVGRTTVTSGLSGIWSVLLWLFVTPFYWFTAVWYRRMRHITLGDWFVERYHSKMLGVAYILFAIVFYMYYLGLGFTAIAKVGSALVDVEAIALPLTQLSVPIGHALIYLCALAVLIYGVLGGLRAAYWTDVIQGIFIIILSVMIIPLGLNALVDGEAARQGVDPATMSTLDGFKILHEQVPDEYFKITESPRGGEFPLYYIVAITILNLVAIVVHPHMAVTGGGSAKSENSARVGLVVGNFLKRFCTIGWSITILIVLALLAGNLEINEDPDKAWGVAAREILGPMHMGLVGLMLACLMAALMSSASAYMLIVSALVVRNGYAAYIDSNASEKTYVFVGRIVGILVIVGGVWIAVVTNDVLEQLKIAWEMPILFAAVFWLGMFWRRATKWAAWATVLFTLMAFFAVPVLLPIFMSEFTEDSKYAVTNDFVTTTVTRDAVPTDVAQRNAQITLWDNKVAEWLKEDSANSRDEAEKQFGKRPEPRALGESMQTVYKSGGKPIYWTAESALPIDENGNVQVFDDAGKVTAIILEDGSTRQVDAEHEEYVLEEVSTVREDEHTVVVRQRFRADCHLRGQGQFRIDFLLYNLLEIDMKSMDNAALETLRLPTRVVLPFVVMIFLSLITPRVDRTQLDRFYVKMKTPVIPEPEADERELALSYEDPARFDDKRLTRLFGLEIQKPSLVDLFCFAGCFAICFFLIWVTVWLAQLGS